VVDGTTLKDAGSAFTVAVRVARKIQNAVTLFAGTSLRLMAVESEISGAGKELLRYFWGASKYKPGHSPNIGNEVMEHISQQLNTSEVSSTTKQALGYVLQGRRRIVVRFILEVLKIKSKASTSAADAIFLR
jgi:hypothetical protein